MDSSKRGVWSLTEKGLSAELTQDAVLECMKQVQSQPGRGHEYGWTDNRPPPLESDSEKRVEEEGDRRQAEAKSQEQSYQRGLNVSEHHPDSGEHRDSGEEEDFDRDLTPRGPDLPELSDTTHWDDVEGEDSNSAEGATAADPDAERFLETLSSSSDDRHESEVDASTVRRESLQESFVDDLLTRLERELTRQTEFPVERVLNELRVMFAVDGETLQALIAYHSEHRLLHTRVFLPFVEDAALELLRLFGQSEFTGIICIENYMQEPHYVIRRKISTATGSVNEFVNTVQQLLSEGVRASKVLRTYQNVKVPVGTVDQKVVEPLGEPTSTEHGITATVYAIRAVRGANAKATFKTRRMVVLKGSEIATSTVKSFPEGYVKLREKLLEEEVVVEQSGKLVFSKDHVFATPSAAAAIVMGRTADGPTEWKDSAGRALKQNDGG